MVFKYIYIKSIGLKPTITFNHRIIERTRKNPHEFNSPRKTLKNYPQRLEAIKIN